MANEDFQRDADYRDILEGFKVPTIAHELGQWWSYPDFKEIDKYTGVLRPFTLETFRDGVKAAGMLGDNEELRLASGRLAVELYKEEIERQLRTPGLGGFQLLDLRDYSGQGVALVGLLDSFWDSKGFVTPAAFREFCAPTVLLSRLSKQVVEEGETLRVPLEVHHYGREDLKSAVVKWQFKSGDGTVLAEGRTEPRDVARGANTLLGEAGMTIGAGPAREMTLVAKIVGHEISNRWRVWSYPKAPVIASDASKVKVADRLDEALLDFVEKGGRALVIADRLDYQVPVYFTNPIWTPQNNIETTGLLIRETHGALAEFPTAPHSDFQWHNFLRPGRAFIINELPEIKPIIGVIEAPSLMRNFRLATVLAARHGKGALVLTSLNLREDLEARPEARQLRQSLVNYLARGQFSEEATLSRQQLESLFKNPRFGVVGEPKGAPRIDVDPSVNAPGEGFTAWTPEVDRVNVATPGFGYRFEAADTRWRVRAPVDMVVRKGATRALSLHRSTLIVNCPKGFAGTIHLLFQDPENSGKRDGYVFGLGGAVMSGKQTSAGRWAAIRVRPEDSASGEVRLFFRKLSYGEGWSATPLVTRLVVTDREKL